MNQQTQVRKFDKQAKKYERLQTKDPTSRYRKRIIPEASGKVLEVAVGTGLNFPYYNEVEEVIGIDFSSKMLDSARKVTHLHSFPIQLQQADVEEVNFEENQFDTIVSTLSFCSYENPVTLLNRFNRWCKPGGQILMMEHGKCTNRVLAWGQKQLDPLAYKMIGCHQDREISRFVVESDLEVHKFERALAGFLYFIWAKPNK
ncbi:class I SAM-dependent methyltransferase [Pseudalkalibacillus sp. Hm43]|uniref:class I SAM-dependent methyltransferase n=1 Tax=Pseudalkalibacillus sp. Hm43 TaxID=3450742 RepID=UPI003F43D0AE